MTEAGCVLLSYESGPEGGPDGTVLPVVLRDRPPPSSGPGQRAPSPASRSRWAARPPSPPPCRVTVRLCRYEVRARRVGRRFCHRLRSLWGSACCGKRTTPTFCRCSCPFPQAPSFSIALVPVALRVSHPLPPPSAFAHRLGRGATLVHPPDGRPGNGRLLPPLLPLSGSLPARACGASDPCGKASNPPERAGGDWRLLRSSSRSPDRRRARRRPAEFGASAGTLSPKGFASEPPGESHEETIRDRREHSARPGGK